ncbi:MAG: transposase, partial [Methylocystis sp.]|nr:transposase [Methylocystis sp.]
RHLPRQSTHRRLQGQCRPCRQGIRRRCTAPKTAKAGLQACHPPKKNRKLQRGYDKDLYIERNLIERFFNKLKQFRRVATRCGKLLANFMGFVKTAAIAIWIK